MKRNLTTALLLLVCAFAFTFAQNSKHVKASFKPAKISGNAGEIVNVTVKFEIEKEWHVYPVEKQENPKLGVGPMNTEFSIEPKKLFKVEGKIEQKGKVITSFDEGFEMNIKHYDGKVEFVVPIKISESAPKGKQTMKIKALYQACKEGTCVSDEVKSDIEVDILKGGEAGALVSADTVVKVDTAKVAAPAPVNSGANVTDSQREINQKKSEGVWSFLWFSMTAGALALLTPCVFPMVPITVSFFTKRAEKNKNRKQGIKDSIVYALGIIITFTALGFILAPLFGGATGIQNFATNPFVNMFIAGIFIVFALNLFGAFEIQLPTGIMNKLNQKSSQSGGMIGVLLMGLTFSLTSFTCTVPFVGSALMAASGGEWFYPIIGMLGFSTVFAAPFFLLALFPSAMSALPKAGGWMNNVKVVMGFLEIAAALKFISNVDLVCRLGIMPPDIFLSIWIACTALMTLYVLGVFKFKHDSDVQGITAMRAIFAILFGAITFYLTTGLMGKSLGELNAFLPPPDYEQLMSNHSGTVSKAGIGESKKESKEDAWIINDYKKALEESKKTGKPLFVDFSGYTCTNCRLMENKVFVLPSISSKLEGYIRVRLYTDRAGEPYETFKKLQQEKYGSIELPLYVILKNDESFVASKSFTRDENDFNDFLAKGLNK